jgi:hypothetical protein
MPSPGSTAGPVLFVIGKWYGFRPGNPPSNHCHNLVGSLVSTGMAPHLVFPVDEITLTHGVGCDRALVDLCQRVRPALVVVGLSLAAAMFERFLPRVETLRRLRRELGVPIVGVLGDTCRPGFMDLANAYAPGIDVFNVWDNYTVYQREADDPAPYWPTWTPQDPRLFREAGVPRDVDVAFVGMRSSGPERSAALAALQDAGIQVTAIGGQGDACVPIETLAATYQRARIVVNFAAVHGEVTACRGRVFEATSCGALLVERSNEHTDRWLQPGVHYAPWRDLDDLVATVRHHLGAEGRRAQCARRGHEFVTAHWHAQAYWHALLQFAAGVPLPQFGRHRLVPA